MAQTKSASPATTSFEDYAVPVMQGLQSALAEMVGSLPETIRRAVDLERSLRLERKLAWQIFRISRTADLAEVGNVPSLVSIARVIEAARKKGVRDEVLRRVHDSFEQFENLASVHGGDRHGLMSMVSGLSPDKSDLYDLNVRKSLFRGNSHIWGVQARMAVRTGIFIPRPGTDRVEDIALVIGDIDLMRRRQSEPLVMLWWLWTSDFPGAHVAQAKQDRPSRKPNGDRTPVDHGLEILPEFSTRPLPEMVSKQGVDGTPETELIFPPGRAGAISMYSLQRRENVPSAAGSSFFGQTLFTMPLEAMVWELLVPVGWSNPATARASIFGRRHHPEQVYEERTADLLSQRETLDYLGVHEGVPPLGGDPSHAGAVRHAIERSGWLGTRFDVYRCRVEYPIMYTMLVVRIDALKR